MSSTSKPLTLTLGLRFQSGREDAVGKFARFAAADPL